jgi:hypothetical protein
MKDSLKGCGNCCNCINNKCEYYKIGKNRNFSNNIYKEWFFGFIEFREKSNKKLR